MKNPAVFASVLGSVDDVVGSSRTDFGYLF